MVFHNTVHNIIRISILYSLFLCKSGYRIETCSCLYSKRCVHTDLELYFINGEGTTPGELQLAVSRE